MSAGHTNKPDIIAVALRAAHIVSRSVTMDGRCVTARDVHGPGVFSTPFATCDALHAFVAAPVYNSVVYHDRQATLGMGDAAEAAVARESAGPVVVVTCVEAGVRVTLRRRNDPSPCIERNCKFIVHKVDTESEPLELTDARHAEIDLLARARVATCVRNKRVILMGTDDELDTQEAFDVESSGFDDILANAENAFKSSGAGNLPLLIDTLRKLWREHDPNTHCVVWVRDVREQDGIDAAWLIERSSSAHPIEKT